MKSAMSNTIKLINNNPELQKKFPREVIPFLLKAVENADNRLKSSIENQIVRIGEAAIPELIEALDKNSGAIRGMAAMCLVRLGCVCIAPLKTTLVNQDWMVNYIINEIEGTKIPLTSFYEEKVLVG